MSINKITSDAGQRLKLSPEMQEFFKSLKERNTEVFFETEAARGIGKEAIVWNNKPAAQRTDIVDIDPRLAGYAANLFADNGITLGQIPDMERDEEIRALSASKEPRRFEAKSAPIEELNNKSDIQLALDDLRLFTKMSTEWPKHTKGMNFEQSDSYIKAQHNSFLLAHPQLLKWISLY